MTDRRILCLALAGLNWPNHHLTGVHTRPDLYRRTSFGPQPIVQTSNVLLYTQGGVERTLRMILVSNRRSKQGEDPVAR